MGNRLLFMANRRLHTRNNHLPAPRKKLSMFSRHLPAPFKRLLMANSNLHINNKRMDMLSSHLRIRSKNLFTDNNKLHINNKKMDMVNSHLRIRSKNKVMGNSHLNTLSKQVVTGNSHLLVHNRYQVMGSNRLPTIRRCSLRSIKSKNICASLRPYPTDKSRQRLASLSNPTHTGRPRPQINKETPKTCNKCNRHSAPLSFRRRSAPTSPASKEETMRIPLCSSRQKRKSYRGTTMAGRRCSTFRPTLRARSAR